jgi:lysophospholipase L1-like esterase
MIFLAVMAGFVPGSLSIRTGVSRTQTDRTNFKFDFGPGKVARGYIQVLPATVYTKERGYGFVDASAVSCVDRGGPDALRRDFCTSDQPFFFSVDLPEGNYNVAVTLGDLAGETTTTVKAESRRLMLERVHTAPGKFETRTFTVNIRTSQIASGGQVRLKDREQGALHWDNKLTLEFGGTRPCVCALEITKVDNAVTVYLAGDSTVTDQTREPWNSWGQMLTRFFKPGVAVANHAESGETLKAFMAERRLEKVLSQIKAGDYLFIQFAHNDMKPGANYLEPFTSYKEHLKRYIAEARKRGATPVLVTPMHRRTFDDAGQITNSLGDYPEAVRQTAKEEKVALIDLNAMSKSLYEALGPENSKKAFVDNTHHNSYGSYELAKCIVEGIKANKLGLAKYLVGDVPPFDPSHPDPLDSFHVPASPPSTIVEVEGLSAAEFARLVREFSEEGGYFRSDNFTSNETSYLTVVDKLRELGASGGAYLGVGPEQNFTYIAKLRPRIAFIVDIRRQAVIQHLMFKAIFHLSPNRFQFLSRLLSRPLSKENAPAPSASLDEVLTFFTKAAGNDQVYATNLAAIRKVIREDFQFPLSEGDQASLEYVYKNFRNEGLDIAFGIDGSWGGYFPTLKDLILQTDLHGRRGNFLADTEDYDFVRDLQRRNLIIPVVGDFAGKKALAAVGDYLRKGGLTVTAFYTSNVEQYLFSSASFTAFANNVRKLPVTDRSLFIRSVSGRYTHPARLPGHRSATLLQQMTVFLRDFDEGRYQSYRDLVTTHYIAAEAP